MLKLLFPHSAALVKAGKTKTLLIADLHIGWELSLEEKGIHVPSQTPRLLHKLTILITKYKPDRLVILGDIKYTVAKTELGEWQDVPDFFEKLQNHVSDIAVVRGNHDGNLEPLLPQKVRLLSSSGIELGDVGVFHGHKWPSPNLLACKTLVMGHLHPVVVLRDPSGYKISRQIWIKTNCNIQALTQTLLQKHDIKLEGTPENTLKKHYGVKPKSMQLFIMPSFNDFLGGRPVNEARLRKQSGDELIGPVLRSEAVDIDNSELYLLDGTFLGTLKQLKT